MASKQEVREFLKAFCEHLDRAGYLLVNKSDDNAACLATLGLTTKQREAIVRQLAHADYCEGPNLREGPEGERVGLRGDGGGERDICQAGAGEDGGAALLVVPLPEVPDGLSLP